MLVGKMRLPGILSGRRCRPDPTLSSWGKVKNLDYSQAIGWHEQFTRYRRLAL
jgi:hypothetical protein